MINSLGVEETYYRIETKVACIYTSYDRNRILGVSTIFGAIIAASTAALVNMLISGTRVEC